MSLMRRDLLLSLGPLCPAVATLLIVHAGLLSWIAVVNSPGVDEPAHLTAGMSHWRRGRFDLYRVNPPLVRSLAAIPILFLDAQVKWPTVDDSPISRPEFGIGSTFCELNGAKAFFYFTMARWFCVPLSVIGGLVVFVWGRALYGDLAGLLSLALWSFSPNVLGNASMITPDAPAASLGVLAVYLFWRWLQQPSWLHAIASGLALGLVELTKSTWVILFGLLPVIWIVWRLAAPRPGSDGFGLSTARSKVPSAWGLAVIVMLAVDVINAGYCFEGSLKPLREFSFASQLLGGPDAHEEPGNRFAQSWLGDVRLPLPANYVRGIDIQRYEFEKGKPSYLAGIQRDCGWWYWYLYALGVKVPIGTMVLLMIATWIAIRHRRPGSHATDDFVLVAPALAVLLLVSSQTGFSRYLRYALPAAPFCHIWIGQAARVLTMRWTAWSATVVGSAILATTSSLATYPHSLSYFNELVGGPRHGADHLLDANIDWGQDIFYLKQWYDAHEEARPLFVQNFGYPANGPTIAGVSARPMPRLVSEQTSSITSFEPPLEPGWYAISANELYGYRHNGSERPVFIYLRRHNPIAMAGYSIFIYRLSQEDVAHATHSEPHHESTSLDRGHEL